MISRLGPSWRCTQVLVQFGSTWCVKCHEFFPEFYSMSKRVRNFIF